MTPQERKKEKKQETKGLCLQIALFVGAFLAQQDRFLPHIQPILINGSG